jgi:hypothetical protein
LTYASIHAYLLENEAIDGLPGLPLAFQDILSISAGFQCTLNTEASCHHQDRDGKRKHIESGIESCSPVEIASEQDIVEYACEYPEFRFFGGIDKRQLSYGKK